MNILIGTSIIFSMMYFQYHILERGKIICGREKMQHYLVHRYAVS
jgi:hypothetical protein